MDGPWPLQFRSQNRSKKKNRFLVPRSKLDLAAKIHDFNYGNRSITTEEADEQFYGDTKETGLL